MASLAIWPVVEWPSLYRLDMLRQGQGIDVRVRARDASEDGDGDPLTYRVRYKKGERRAGRMR